MRPGKDGDVSDGEQHSQDEASATTGKEPKTSKQGNSVHSGPNKKIADTPITIKAEASRKADSHIH